MAKAAQSPSQLRIGKAIRGRRSELGISLATLAADLGIASSSLSKLENGLTPITFERLERISQLLGVDMALLLGDRSTRRPANEDEAAPEEKRRQTYGARRIVTRSGEEQLVEGGVYNLLFHATELLEKRFQPMVAEVHCTDISVYGPFRRHNAEEFNYVLSGVLEFHSEVYAPVVLKAGDSIYFDAEMGHAHIRLGDEPCRLLGIITPRITPARSGLGPDQRIDRPDDSAPSDRMLRI